jgi:CRISPR/Cas system Type II protein with McrA/HNH and RuvC-like nuclease domain
MEIELKSIINDLIKEDHYQEIINSEDFYSEKLKVLFNEYKTFSIGQLKESMEEFINNPPESFHFQEFLDRNKDTTFIEFLELIGRMITIL